MATSPLPPELESFLARPNPAVIATLGKDGSPQAVPTWYLWEDGRVLVNMDESRVRIGHMRRDPRVALSVMDADDWYGHVSLLGRVTSLEPDEDLSDIDRLAMHYGGEPYPNRSDSRVSAWIEITNWHRWRV